MPIFPSFAPPSSFRLGLRAITGKSGKSGISFATRSISTPHNPLAPCFRYSSNGAHSPLRILINRPSYNLSPRRFAGTLFRFRAITEYVNIPDSYEDAEGLPFRKEDLNQREVNQIFGHPLPSREANKLLRILHGRRVAGTLEDPNLQVNTAHFSESDKAKALKYLRANIPVEEVINAGLRAEDELKYLEEQQGKDDAEQQFEETSPQNPPSKNEVQNVNVLAGKLPKPRKSDSPYGEGAFDRIRAANIARREAEEKRLAEEQKKREEEEALKNVGTLQTQQEKPRRELSPRMKKWTERATSDLEEPPEMKAWERLLPSLAMTLLVLAACATYATLYTPPKRSKRLWPDIPPAAATCLALIGINLACWICWKLPPLWYILNRYMIVVAATPRPMQLVGAIFSHHKFSHLAMNMVVFWFFGTRLHDEVGRGNFLAIYLASGTLGFMGSLANLVLMRGLNYTTLGASGAVYGIATAYFWLFRNDEFKLFGYPPDPISGPQGLGFIGLMLGLHVLPLLSKKAHGMDVVSHLAGMLGGVVSADLVKKHMDEKERIRAERLKTMGALEKVVQVKAPKTPPTSGRP
ncbi:rhomboid-domain-containing protein [Annulohypoxylon truncatum]|uniref:rhomboid-domain-containing protein n=1 Tax=Annulohypoxylon truncatum TaxID=327061 RepID=UPI002007C4B9|nr:rhomboid-domain-containing protein [Annulohypoxylon truncatum]KAI1209412.1 rhomboid-domain-containing protein [Annulohypoxylon truncatum]